jgi:hypothetical protein
MGPGWGDKSATGPAFLGFRTLRKRAAAWAGRENVADGSMPLTEKGRVPDMIINDV